MWGKGRSRITSFSNRLPNRMRIRLLAVLLLLSSAAFAAVPSAEDLDKRRKALGDLIEEQWQYNLRTSPEYASMLGDKRYNDQSSDLSLTARRKDVAQERAFLKRAEAIDGTGFSDQEKINKTLFIRNRREAIENYEAKDWEMPVNQMGGV